MIVTCPTCSARYNMNSKLIDPENGRIVRCSSCSHSWRIYRDNSQEEDDDIPEVKSALHKSKNNYQSQSSENNKKKKSFLGLMIGVNFLVFLFLSFGYLMREEIVKILPQTERFYQLLGIDIKVTGISLMMPYLEKIDHNDGHTSLLIQGSFLNSHPKETLAIPRLKVILLNDANLSIGSFVKSDFKPATLPPGGVSAFTIEVPQLPKEAVDVFIEFENKNK